MFFRQYQLSCLSLFSYLIGDETTGRAVVVDPQRDVTGYLDDARDHGLTIERVIETHVHADFVSGHLELARATGAAISYGSAATTEFPISPLDHGQRLSLGQVTLEVRHTPGHTPESISLVLWPTPPNPSASPASPASPGSAGVVGDGGGSGAGDEAGVGGDAGGGAGGGVPWGVLTGDALFVGDVGRPDLLTSVGFTADDLARRLYRSLHEQLLTLPDETRVFPAHGAGSACGRAMSDAVSSTIGEQRAGNYALQPMSEDAFVEVVTEGQSVAPLYFAYAADTNRRWRDLLDDAEPPAALPDAAVVAALGSPGVMVLDTRPPETFASGHLRGSVNVGLDGRFAEYTGDVVRPGQGVIIVADEARATEARVRLARIGFDDVRGAVVDVERLLADRPDLAATAARVAAADVASWRDDHPGLQVVDVRNPAEQEAGVLPGALRIPLARLLDGAAELDPAAPTVVYCAGGYRSSIAASLLRSLGFTQVADLQGGYGAWLAADLPTTAAPPP